VDSSTIPLHPRDAVKRGNSSPRPETPSRRQKLNEPARDTGPCRNGHSSREDATVKFQLDKANARYVPRVSAAECQTIKDDGDDGRASYSQYGTRVLEYLQSRAITADCGPWPLPRGESLKIYESPSTVRVPVSRGRRARARSTKERKARAMALLRLRGSIKIIIRACRHRSVSRGVRHCNIHNTYVRALTHERERERRRGEEKTSHPDFYAFAGALEKRRRSRLFLAAEKMLARDW